MIKVFSGSSKHTRPTDINIFDQYFFTTPLLQFLRKRVEITNDEVDRLVAALHEARRIFGVA